MFTLNQNAEIVACILLNRKFLIKGKIVYLRTFARKFSNIDFFLKNLPLKVDELGMSEMKKKIGVHRLRLRKNMPGRTPKSKQIGLR